jgi:predicted MPP superfamily phosphohydrolase
MPASMLYNLFMTGVDLAVLGLLWHVGRRTAPVWLGAMAAAGAAAVVAAGVLGEDPFGVCRLATYGLFLHGTLLLLVSGLLLWRATRPLAAASLVAAAALAAVAADAFLVEPTWLDVSHVRIASQKIDAPLRIVLLADLQTDRFGAYEQEVFRRTMEAGPDLILLGGDYLQARGDRRKQLRRQLVPYLREIGFGAPRGVFAIRGNCDADDWPALFDGLGVTAVETTGSFDVGPLRLGCLSIGDSYNPELVLRNDNPQKFRVVLGHCPNFALGGVDADLLLAGHTHGGQVRLPLIGPLATLSEVPRRWAAGRTELSGGRTLVVSRGIGMERLHAPRLRFLCRPELVIIDLLPAEGR